MISERGGMEMVPRYVHIMLLLGFIMTCVYSYVYFVCYLPFNQHVAKENWKNAGDVLGRIRKLVGLNLTLGLITVGVAVIGVTWA
jgi:uncharacterized membrane protein